MLGPTALSARPVNDTPFVYSDGLGGGSAAEVVRDTGNVDCDNGNTDHVTNDRCAPFPTRHTQALTHALTPAHTQPHPHPQNHRPELAM